MTHRGCQLCAVPRLNLQWQAVFWWVCSREMGAAFADTLRRKITVFSWASLSFDVV